MCMLWLCSGVQGVQGRSKERFVITLQLHYVTIARVWVHKVHTHAHTYLSHTHTCTRLGTKYTHAHTHTHIFHIHTHMLMHTHTYTHAHTHTHTCTHAQGVYRLVLDLHAASAAIPDPATAVAFLSRRRASRVHGQRLHLLPSLATQGLVPARNTPACAGASMLQPFLSAPGPGCVQDDRAQEGQQAARQEPQERHETHEEQQTQQQQQQQQQQHKRLQQAQQQQEVKQQQQHKEQHKQQQQESQKEVKQQQPQAHQPQGHAHPPRLPLQRHSSTLSLQSPPLATKGGWVVLGGGEGAESRPLDCHGLLTPPKTLVLDIVRSTLLVSVRGNALRLLLRVQVEEVLKAGL